MSKVLDRVQPKSVMSGRCRSKTNQDQNPTAYRTDAVENENFVPLTVQCGVGDGRLGSADSQHTAGRRQAGNLPSPTASGCPTPATFPTDFQKKKTFLFPKPRVWGGYLEYLWRESNPRFLGPTGQNRILPPATLLSAAFHRLWPPNSGHLRWTQKKKKKKKRVFFLCVYYPCFCFPTSMFRHIAFEGDVNVYVGLVPNW